ncbi:MAG: hypothetical protein COB93_02480 [Sneathiella sp.]|nr:MAG: hypothetical protein COB93_02480 [Sneathiella sp.]
MTAQNLHLTVSDTLPDEFDIFDMVRLRLLEMADTIAHANVGFVGPSSKVTWWPETKDGNDYAKDSTRYRPDAAALSRADESLGWISQFIDDDQARTALSNWLRCMVLGSHEYSFAAWCKKNGKIRRTADRQIRKSIQQIAASLCKSGVLLHAPEQSRVSTFAPKQGINPINIARVNDWLHYGESIKLQDLPEHRDLTWAAKQNDRRRQRVARAKKQAQSSQGASV